MSTASLSNGNGPGSSIPLAPETIRVRNALIEKFSGAPLEEMNNFMTLALSNESDELRRLGILAARIYILRSRVANLKEFNRNPSLTSLPALDTTKLSLNLPSPNEATPTDDDEAPSEIEQWSRIQMTEPGEVNGVRFLTGTIIDAQTHDADKLIGSGKAVRVDMDGNIIDHHADDFTDSDAPANDSDTPTNDSDTPANDSDAPANDIDETAQTVSDDTSTTALSDNDLTAPTASDDAPRSDEPQEINDSEANASGGSAQTDDNADEDPKAPIS